MFYGKNRPTRLACGPVLMFMSYQESGGGIVSGNKFFDVFGADIDVVISITRADEPYIEWFFLHRGAPYMQVKLLVDFIMNAQTTSHIFTLVGFKILPSQVFSFFGKPDDGIQG